MSMALARAVFFTKASSRRSRSSHSAMLRLGGAAASGSERFDMLAAVGSCIYVAYGAS